MPLLVDVILPVKLALKNKLNPHGGLYKFNTSVCLMDDMQINDGFNFWSPTASTRLLKYFITDSAQKKLQSISLI